MLRNTVFRYHPSRLEREPFSTFHDTEHEEDITIIHMARMMESMDDIYTLRERESRREAEAQAEQIRRLEKEVQDGKKVLAQQRRILYLQS
ncbi:hypothetical protein ABZP36_012695 [Zizania latifolia]